MRTCSLIAILTLASCGLFRKDEPETAAWAPDLHCPGDPSGICDNAEGALHAGASQVSITPTCFESWTDANGNGEYKRSEGDDFLDCGCDRLCPEDEGYSGADDGEGDEEFQAVWLAGFQNGRPAADIHDELWARAVVFEQGQTRVGIVAVDLVGWFHDDVESTRAMLEEQGLVIDYLVVASTHQHEGPDTVGLWGQRTGKTGYDPDYAGLVREACVQALKEAIDGLTEVSTMKAGYSDARDYSEKGTRNLIRDSRDPQVVDERINAAWFGDASGETILTLVNWANHPEVLSDENTSITSDYSHYLRNGIEGGVQWDDSEVEGLGGIAIYLNGTVGGLMTPLGVTVTDGNGVDYSESTWAKSEALGKVVAEMGLDAIAAAEVIESPELSFEMMNVSLPVDNIGFQAMFLSGVLDRALYDFDETAILTEENVPKVHTEVSHISIGSLELLGIPGELFPELAFGGYDGSKIGNDIEPLIHENHPNPPDLANAPDGPYWAELLETEHAWIVGLANDEIGYIVPAYDFEVHPTVPFLDEAEGDHYEETNSLGPATEPILDETVRTLLGWTP